MLVIQYTFFATIATVVNLCSQALSFSFYSATGAIYLAMFLGTLNGLICKYFLDKHFIFSHQAKSKQDDVIKFLLYSLMGVATTLIFWVVEISFDSMFTHPNAKYIGAVIGLSIGYVIKYHLDKHLVFKTSNGDFT